VLRVARGTSGIVATLQVTATMYMPTLIACAPINLGTHTKVEDPMVVRRGLSFMAFCVGSEFHLRKSGIEEI